MTLNLREYASTTVRVTDGAWGTQLQQLGLPPGAVPELWNVENPPAVEAVARSYVQAGSDVILTNTFGGNRFVLGAHHVADRTVELVEAGTAISRRAADTGPQAHRPQGAAGALVFASIGPTGKMVMMGDVGESELAEAFAESARATARGGADAVVLESFAELAELKIALQAVRGACDLPIVVSMTFASGPEGTATMMGDSPGDLAAAAEAGGAACVGANCGAGPANFVKVARLLGQATDLPVWIKANAGLPQMVEGKTTFPMGPDEFAAYVPPLIDAGARFLGGCCGTGPEHIRAVRSALDQAAG